MVHLLASEVRQLLHNKFVVVLGDSVQRAVYKDLVLLLQRDCLLTTSQLKAKGEECFEQDELVEGGQYLPLHNGTHYREVRQFCTGHHLVRFYFLTRVYSDYLQEVLEQLQSGEHTPDVVIMNSCLWDLSRYGPSSLCSYQENLDRLFEHLNRVLPQSCLVVWNTAMPVAENITAGVLPPKHQTWSTSLKTQVVEANFYSSSAAGKHHFDVLDLHFHFRHAHQYRQGDGVHWNQRAHRQLTQLLLAHVADAWGVDLPQRDPVGKWIKTEPARPEQEGKRQPQASMYEPAPFLPQPLPPPVRRPLHRFPPPSSPPWAPFDPYRPPPPPPPLMSPILFNSPDACPPSDCFFQPTQFSLDDFHSDAPLPMQSGFALENDFMYDPRPPMPLFPRPCRPPLVDRGFSRFRPRGPYGQWRQRPRPYKRKSQAHQGPRPQ